jgi:site-specific recombinase XerD
MIYPVHDVVEQIRNTSLMQEFIEDLTPEAQHDYLIIIAGFCKVNNLSPEELISIAEQEQKDKLPFRDLSLKRWLKNYENHCEEYNRTINTYNYRVSVIKAFFLDHEINIPTERHRKRKKKKLKFKTRNKRERLTPEYIRACLKNTRKPRENAMILTQCSSGLSSKDLLNLTYEEYLEGLVDIGDDRQICQLHFQHGRSKTEALGTEFYTFISFEGVEAINTYLEVRKTINNPTKYLFLTRENTQVNRAGYGNELIRINRDMNLEHTKGEYRQVTSHMFRKFFYTQLSNTELNYQALKTMMGHVVPGVDGRYYVNHPDDLRELYIKYMPALLVYDYESVNIVTTDAIVKEQDEKIKQLIEDREEMKKDLERVKQALEMKNNE